MAKFMFSCDLYIIIFADLLGLLPSKFKQGVSDMLTCVLIPLARCFLINNHKGKEWLAVNAVSEILAWVSFSLPCSFG